MELIKVILNLPSDLVDKLKAESVSRNLSMTEVIKRGLEAYLFLINEESKGSKILIQKSDNKIVKILMK